MRSAWSLLFMCHAVLAGNLYSPVGYAAYPGSTLVSPQPVSPLHYASPLRSSVGYGPLAAARVNNIAAPVLAPAPLAAAPAVPVATVPASPIVSRAYTAPIAPAFPSAYATPFAPAFPRAYAAPVAPAFPRAYAAPVAPVFPRAYAAPVFSRAYAAPVSPVVARAYAAPVAPVVSRAYAAIPTVADVPITRYEARPGFIQNYVDVAHPKVATRKIQVRRPAIQKQFYDIEERIIVRPIASAVVELDQPLSKTQAGPTLVSPALPAAPGLYPALPVPANSPVPVPALPPFPTYGPPQPLPPPSAPANPQFPPPSAPETPQFPPPSAPENPQFPPSGSENPQFPPPSAPQNPEFPETSGPGTGQESDDSDSITVDNEDVRARSSSSQPSQARQSQPQPQSERNPQPNEPTEEPDSPQARSGPIPSAPQEAMPQTEARFLSRSQNPLNSINNLIPQSRSFPEETIPSSRSLLTEAQSQSNQQQLIELLTGRGGVAEVRSGVSIEAAGDVGQIRGRVLSVTPAPSTSGPSDERVSTRRVVVSRPIQTLQEVDVVQPFTKIHRLSVQQPAILKTPTVGIARVKTFAPLPVTSYGAYSPYSYIH